MARYGSWRSHATAVIFTLDQPHRPGWFYACLSGILQVMITGLPEFPMCRSARTCISSVRGGTSRSGIDNEGRTRNERDRVRSSVTWSHSGNRLFVELTYKLGLDWRPLPRGLVRLLPLFYSYTRSGWTYFQLFPVSSTETTDMVLCSRRNIPSFCW